MQGDHLPIVDHQGASCSNRAATSHQKENPIKSLVYMSRISSKEDPREITLHIVIQLVINLVGSTDGSIER